jgi:hypothetical protein
MKTLQFQNVHLKFTKSHHLTRKFHVFQMEAPQTQPTTSNGEFGHFKPYPLTTKIYDPTQ